MFCYVCKGPIPYGMEWLKDILIVQTAMPTGIFAIVIVKSYYKHPECRLIHHIYVVSNKSSDYYDTACRTDGGDWSIIR